MVIHGNPQKYRHGNPRKSMEISPQKSTGKKKKTSKGFPEALPNDSTRDKGRESKHNVPKSRRGASHSPSPRPPGPSRPRRSRSRRSRSRFSRSHLSSPSAASPAPPSRPPPLPLPPVPRPPNPGRENSPGWKRGRGDNVLFRAGTGGPPNMVSPPQSRRCHPWGHSVAPGLSPGWFPVWPCPARALGGV